MKLIPHLLPEKKRRCGSRIGAKGLLLLELCPLLGFHNYVHILFNNLNVSGPTSMKLISYLVPEKKEV